MRRATAVYRFAAATLPVVIAVAGCEEISTQVSESTFRVELAATSPFVDNGDYLVGDLVQFVATVTENGQPVTASGQRFTSSNPAVVRILDPTTGTAEFVSVGSAMVSVTFEEPRLEGSEKLTASLTVQVTTYVVQLSLTSVVTGAPVDATAGLVGDTVQVFAAVTKDGQPVASGGISVMSSDAAVARPVPGTSDRVAFTGEGSARLTVTLQKPDVPGTDPLAATLDLAVKPFRVELSVGSLVAPSLAAGDTLVTDSVRFRALVIESASDTVPISGTVWMSSDPSVVRITDDTAGVAVFAGVGQATISVTFQDPKLPGAPFQMPVRVTTLVGTADVESVITGPGPLADTLLSDTVRFTAGVTKDGQSWPGPVTLFDTQSSDPTVVNVIDGPGGLAVLSDTGQATVTLTLADPVLPRDTLRPTLTLPVATYVARISQASPDTTPAMGDSIDYDVVVTYTRDGSTVPNPTVTFASSDASVIPILDAATGRAFARDTGQALVSVVVVSPSLPAAVVTDTLPPAATTIVHERFYGGFSKTSGNFGVTAEGDTVVVTSSAVHRFTDSTRVVFPNGTVGFVISAIPDALKFLVPAGGDTGALLMRNLQDDAGLFRDGVPTRIVFSGPGAGGVDDFYEPNDAFPLTTAVEIQTFPFEALLSWDPSKTQPADSNFFYFSVPSGQNKTLDIIAEWQVDADLDFKVCSATGGPPPTGYVIPLACPRPASMNSSSLRREEELNLFLSAGQYVVVFYCVSCPALPLTYRVTIIQR